MNKQPKIKRKYRVECDMVKGDFVDYNIRVEVEAYSEKQAIFFAGRTRNAVAVNAEVEELGVVVPDGMKYSFGQLVDENQLCLF